MKVLVTGGCGFMGSNFILYMLKKYRDYKIINLDKLTYAGNKKNLKSIEKNSRYKFVKGDICDRELVNSLVKDVDVIVHFAAESHVDRSILDPDVFIKTNVFGTYVLLESALKNGKKRIHHISTDEVFGSLGETGKFSENSAYRPSSPYASSKATSDDFAISFYRSFRLPVTISNSSNNYGPYQFPEKIIPLFVTNLLENKKIPVYGTGLNVRDWLYVDDHNKAVDLILHKGKIGESYCIGGNSEKRNIEVAKMIIKDLDFGDEMIESVEDRKHHDFRYAIDFTKIKATLGWKPKTSFEQGLRKTIEWYKLNKEWWKPLKKKVIKNITKKQ